MFVVIYYYSSLNMLKLFFTYNIYFDFFMLLNLRSVFLFRIILLIMKRGWTWIVRLFVEDYNFLWAVWWGFANSFHIFSVCYTKSNSVFKDTLIVSCGKALIFTEFFFLGQMKLSSEWTVPDFYDLIKLGSVVINSCLDH